MTALFLVDGRLSRFFPYVPALECNPSILVGEATANIDDDSYSKVISKIRFGRTSKTTSKGRHVMTNEFLTEFFTGKFPSILDVGASDGSTSLDFINQLNKGYSKYYITDYHLWAAYAKYQGHLYIFDLTSSECVLVSNKIYAVRPNVSKIARRCFSRQINRLKKDVNKLPRVALLHPSVKEVINRNDSILVQEFSVFDNWSNNKVDLIKVANVLNKVYFSDENIMAAIFNLSKVLNENGVLALVHNTGEEAASFYQKIDDELVLIKKLNDGVAIDHLIANCRGKAH